MDKLVDKIKEALIDEFILQGHNNTGAFEQSLRSEVVTNGNMTTINIYGNEYGLYLSKGVTADKIPYTPKKRGEGSGGQSKYIQGLINWVSIKFGIGGKEGQGIAFAIAKKHSEEGMPVRGGKLGSGFIEDVNKKHQQEINALAKEEMDKIIKKTLNIK